MTEASLGSRPPAPLKDGDPVRFKRPDGFLASFAKKVAGRRATLTRTYTRAGSDKVTAVVHFHKRAGRGKDFEEHLALDSICLDEEA